MFKSITSRINRDGDYPERAFRIDMLTRVLDGTLYDHIPNDFHTEKSASGEYIPLRDRRPSVKYALCRTVVDDAVSLLFSEGHFPALACADAELRGALARIMKESRLNAVMIDAAMKGSVGSVAIRLRVLDNRVFFDALGTQYLTPAWCAQAPDTLERVTEKYKVKGSALAAAGYTMAPGDFGADFWFQRVWDAQAETWYLPWSVQGENQTPQIDLEKSTAHGLGVVPLVWVRNLPGGDDIDGECTFAAAIDTGIEIDYLLSQAGRGLKYSADPTLLIKEPAIGSDGQLIKGAGNAIAVGPDGDAKLLEINGSAAQAVVEFVRCLRELALESIHGNRANADRASVAPSGRAMELMNLALIWLADRLRISYGEGALLDLLHLVIRARQVFALVDKRGNAYPEFDAKAELSLRWPAWQAPSATDKNTNANTLCVLLRAGLISQETAVAIAGDDYDVEFPAEELGRIRAESVPT